MKTHGWNFFFIILMAVLVMDCSAQSSAPSDEITFDFTQISTDSPSIYSVKARYYSSQVYYCFLRITDVTKANYPVLMMRLDSSHNKLWITTFVETYFSGPRDTSSIFLADYESTSVTKLYNTTGQFIGVEVNWVFTLCRDNDSPYSTADGEWATQDDQVYFGAYIVGVTEDGYNDSSIPVTYLNGSDNPVSDEWVNNRALYVWDQSNQIIADSQSQREFFSFLAAPHGDSNAKVSVVFMNFDALDIVNNSFDAVRTFVADAHSRGLKVVFLSGDPSWALDYYRSYPVAHLQKVFSYNSKAMLNERLDGIQFNIEPHVLASWPSDTIWEQYIGNLAYFQDMVIDHNNAQADTLTFGVTLPYWYDEYTYNYRPVNEFVQDIVDCVTVINYWTATGATAMSGTEIAYSEALNNGKSVYIALETKDLGTSDPYNYISFWNHGNEALETMISDLETIYSSYSVFTGTAIHYYETDSASDQAYRSLRPDALSEPNQDYDEAPVVTVVAPNSGDFVANKPLEIVYTVFDSDTSQLETSVFLISESEEIQVDVASVTITDGSGLQTVTTTCVPSEMGVSAGDYVVQVIVQDPLTGVSSADSSNTSITIEQATEYQPPVANAGGSYETTEGSTVTLDAQASYDPQGSTLTYEWDLNSDGVFEVSGSTQSVTRPDDVTFTVTLKVTNAYGLSAIDTAEVVFLNAAPVVNPLPDVQILIDESVSLPPATYSDAGVDDKHIAIINWGDGTFEQYSVSNGIVTGVHSYSSTGTFSATVTVQDNAGAQGSASFAVSVKDDTGAGTVTHETVLNDINSILDIAYTLPSSRTSTRIITRIEGAKNFIVAYDYSRAIRKLDAALDQVGLLSDDLGLTALIEQLIADLQTL